MDDLRVKHGITIPGHEIDITTSRAGGAGGQHVNKTDTRVTVRWNVFTTNALNGVQKERVLKNLQSRITNEGDLISTNSSTRSQQQNKENALSQLAQEIAKALYVPKKRVATKVTRAAKVKRLQKKSHRSVIKKMRGKFLDE